MAAWVRLTDLLLTDPAKVRPTKLTAHMVAPLDLFDCCAAVRTGPKLFTVPEGEPFKSHALGSLVPPIATLETHSVRALAANGFLLAAAWLLDHFSAIGRRTENQLLVLGHQKFLICRLEPRAEDRGHIERLEVLNVESVCALVLKTCDLGLLVDDVRLDVLDSAINAKAMSALERIKIFFVESFATHVAHFRVGAFFVHRAHKWHLFAF